jgi:hypothetical protein
MTVVRLGRQWLLMSAVVSCAAPDVWWPVSDPGGRQAESDDGPVDGSQAP